MAKPVHSLVISAGSYSFISSDPLTLSNDETLNLLRANKPIKLIHRSNNALPFSTTSFEKINRIQFYYPESALSTCKQLMNQIPTGYELCRFDKNLFDKSNWQDYLLLFMGLLKII